MIRVFQVATGNVGTEMIKRIAAHPDLTLVGLHCYTPEKVGRDAGEIAGLAPNGVIATGTVEEIIAADPDVVTFHGVFPDEDLYVRLAAVTVLGRLGDASPAVREALAAVAASDAEATVRRAAGAVLDRLERATKERA